MKLKKALKLLSKGEFVKIENILLFSDVKTGEVYVRDYGVIFTQAFIPKKGYKKYEPTEMERELIGNFLTIK